VKVVKILVYVDTFVEEVDIAKLLTGIEILKKEFATVQNKMKMFLTELMN
jgi:hypothetical protein